MAHPNALFDLNYFSYRPIVDGWVFLTILPVCTNEEASTAFPCLARTRTKGRFSRT